MNVLDLLNVALGFFLGAGLVGGLHDYLSHNQVRKNVAGLRSTQRTWPEKRGTM